MLSSLQVTSKHCQAKDPLNFPGPVLARQVVPDLQECIPNGIEQPLSYWNGAHLINKRICKRIVTYCQMHNPLIRSSGEKNNYSCNLRGVFFCREKCAFHHPSWDGQPRAGRGRCLPRLRLDSCEQLPSDNLIMPIWTH